MCTRLIVSQIEILVKCGYGLPVGRISLFSTGRAALALQTNWVDSHSVGRVIWQRRITRPERHPRNHFPPQCKSPHGVFSLIYKRDPPSSKFFLSGKDKIL